MQVVRHQPGRNFQLAAHLDQRFAEIVLVPRLGQVPDMLGQESLRSAGQAEGVFEVGAAGQHGSPARGQFYG